MKANKSGKSGKRSRKVYLVGAGPGNPEYLTVKATKLIKKCDVLLYDRLVSYEIVKLVPNTCEKVCVGTSHGLESSFKQEKINELVLKYYRQGKNVVRLKSGDPFIFGRGGEEIEFLKKKNIPYEVVPGLTSAIAVATAIGIPLTHRDYSSSLLIISGHRKDSVIENDWDNIARFDGTIVVLMGVGSSLEIARNLIERGMDPFTGVTVIENGTQKDQRIFVGLLSDLPKIVDKFEVKAPSIIVIGRVINALTDSGFITATNLRGTLKNPLDSIILARRSPEDGSKER
jgi:uroporphyrin-III C-methyltransferase